MSDATWDQHASTPSTSLPSEDTTGPPGDFEDVSTLSSAANDFRSDFVTEPTLWMLKAPISSTLEFDWEEDPTTASFQSFLSTLAGKPATLLVLSGTAGNQMSLRAALPAPPHSVLLDQRSHIINMEAGAVSSLSGSLISPVLPANGHHLTLPDIISHATLSDAVYDCPTRLISLEIPLHGLIMPLADARAISAWAHSQTPPIHMHLDGARLWEAVAAGAGSLADYCAAFDSVTVCVSKGLGAPMGAAVMGSEPFVKRLRTVRKLFGGGMRQSALIAGPATVAIRQTFLGGKLSGAHEKARRIAGEWERLGGRLVLPTETNMVWLDLNAAGVSKEEWWRLAAEGGVKCMMKGRLVVHYQISEESVRRLLAVMETVLGRGGGGEEEQTTSGSGTRARGGLKRKLHD